MDLTLTPDDGYELIATGDGRKLERFGQVLIDRPAPQAIWPRSEQAPWSGASATFARHEDGSGDWEAPRGGRPPGPWPIRFHELPFEIRLTGFGNVGLFPEHAVHWPWLARRLARRPGATVLNLFAYTGGASLAAVRAGARVTHVDAARQVNAWALENARSAGLEGESFRVLAEDALRFVQREVRRKQRYDALILDPPSFGRGPKGEVWKIERDLFSLLDACRELLAEEPVFVLLTAHSPGITPAVLRRLVTPFGASEAGEMLLGGRDAVLPAGAYARCGV